MKFEKIEYFLTWEATPTGFGISTYHWPILTLSYVEIPNPVGSYCNIMRKSI